MSFVLLCSLVVVVFLASTDAAKPYKVFGAGLSKTGTTSLHSALVELGYTAVHHDRMLVPFLSSNRSDGATYNYERYEALDAVTDIPTAYYYRQLLAAYPTAKFILTVRDEEAWYASFSAHQADVTAQYGGSLPFRLAKLTETVYGSLENNKSLWISNYNTHNKHVMSDVPANQLLLMDITKGDGWSALCPFLGETSGACDPDSLSRNRPFPVSNTQGSRNAQNTAQRSAKPRADADATRNAYVSLLVSPSLGGRQKLNSLLLAVKSIRRTGSTQDIVAMVYGTIKQQDADLLTEASIKIVRTGSVGTNLDVNMESFPISAAPAHRAKLRILQLVQYNMAMFFDPDVIFHENADYLFDDEHDFVARKGTLSPIETTLFLIRPSWQALVDINDVALTTNFDSTSGWMEFGAITDWRYPTHVKHTDWSFYGASVEQGLLFYYYFCFRNGENAALIDPKSWAGIATHFPGGLPTVSY